MRFSRNCLKTIQIRSFLGPHFPIFVLNMEEVYSVNIRIQPKCGKIQQEKTPDLDNFHAMWVFRLHLLQICIIFFKHLLKLAFFKDLHIEAWGTSSTYSHMLLLICFKYLLNGDFYVSLKSVKKAKNSQYKDNGLRFKFD